MSTAWCNRVVLKRAVLWCQSLEKWSLFIRQHELQEAADSMAADIALLQVTADSMAV